MSTQSYQMGYTTVEFAKTLRGQFLTEQSDYRCDDISPTQWQLFNLDSSLVNIKITEAPERKIAMLTLPVLHVQFEFFVGQNSEQQQQFLKRFFKYFHKGGG